MYWGSVRFYKHLIVISLTLLLLVPSIIAVNLFAENAWLKKELKTAKIEGFKKNLRILEEESHKEQLIIYAGQKKTVGRNELKYQNMFPDLYVGEIPEQECESDMVYLTFDDGPSCVTEKILDVLIDKEVKATFFVIGKNLKEEKGRTVLKRIVDEGHGIGIHSYSHNYKKIYSSIEDYLEDFNMIYQQIYSITGKNPEIFRFPGGSINGYNGLIYKELIAELMRRGFVYYDWNVSSQDAAKDITEKQIYSRVVNGSMQRERSIVLMHDCADKENTVKALPGIIDELSNCGYSFGTLNRKIAPIIFGYSD